MNFELAAVLALLSAALYGSADFLGGVASKRISTFAVVTVSQFVGLALVAALLLSQPGTPTTPDLMWGALAGLAGGIGVALLYRALAIGTMALVAPTTAVCAVAIPVIAAILLGERPPVSRLSGITLAILAIVLVSQQRSPEGRRSDRRWRLPPGIRLALLSGIAIGFFFLALARTSPRAGFWPLFAAKCVTVSFFVAIAAVTGRTLRIDTAGARIVVAAGAMDMLANALYVVATRYGPLTVVVTLSSLYPASTVVLARLVLGERLNGLQATGIVCALIAVVLIVS